MTRDSKSATPEDEEPLPPVELWCAQETTVQQIRTPSGLVKFDPLLSKALGLTVVWDRPELVRKVLQDGQSGTLGEAMAVHQRLL